MHTTALHEDFGVEVCDIDLRDVTADTLYPELRALFETHSLLLFRGQSLDEDEHRKLAHLFSPLENLTDLGPDETPPRPMVSNIAPDGSLAGQKDLHLLNLKSNFIWHTDSTFLSTPSISNILNWAILNRAEVAN